MTDWYLASSTAYGHLPLVAPYLDIWHGSSTCPVLVDTARAIEQSYRDRSQKYHTSPAFFYQSPHYSPPWTRNGTFCVQCKPRTEPLPGVRYGIGPTLVQRRKAFPNGGSVRMVGNHRLTNEFLPEHLARHVRYVSPLRTSIVLESPPCCVDFRKGKKTWKLPLPWQVWIMTGGDLPTFYLFFRNKPLPEDDRNATLGRTYVPNVNGGTGIACFDTHDLGVDREEAPVRYSYAAMTRFWSQPANNDWVPKWRLPGASPEKGYASYLDWIESIGIDGVLDVDYPTNAELGRFLPDIDTEFATVTPFNLAPSYITEE